MRPLRIGCVKYLNARPLIYGWPGPVDFDHPSSLCQKLARGDLDVALVSSIEYLRRPQCHLVEGVSVAAFGPVHSVIVAHPGGILSAEEIEFDPASETSAALLRCLLADRQSRHRLVGNGGLESRQIPSSAARPRLLIGDQAIRFRELHPDLPISDLAEVWKEVTGLPFVFALWLIRPEVADSAGIAGKLRRLRDENLLRLDEICDRETECPPEFCRNYFRINLRFGFDAYEKAGLLEFHRRCLTCGLDVASKVDLKTV